MQRHDLTFYSQGTACAAWHYPAESSNCVVLGHGLGGTREGMLAQYGERFQKAGLQSLIFDYRHFGDSQGEPRQLGSIPRQLRQSSMPARFRGWSAWPCGGPRFLPGTC